MVDPLTPGLASELSANINRLHINYLQADESPQKIEQRIKLEGFIRKYLCCVAHGRKFMFPETSEILRRSVELKENFSGYRASAAWNAVARYAANLVAQPWRKEFTVIKTFSGFYMHDIEENLVGAELLLERMGYKQVDFMSLVLQQPLDLDAVMEVSRDAIVAFVECQMMKEIWEGVSSHFECSWLDILNYRETHIGSPDNAIKNLTHHFHQNQYHGNHHHHHHPHQLLSGMSFNTAPRFHTHPDANCVYGQSSFPYYGYPYAVSPQPRYACIVSPQHAVGYPLSPVSVGYQQQPKSPADLHPPNGYMYLNSQTLSPHMHNGYGTSQPTSSTALHNYGCIVPTGQLIELESSTPATSQALSSRLQKSLHEDVKTPDGRNNGAVALINSDKPNNIVSERELCRKEIPHSAQLDKSSRPTTLDDLRPKRNGHASPIVNEGSCPVSGRKQPNKFSSRKGVPSVAPMQDGTGTWESWDYVYRNLESIGYNKDVGERGDILHNTSPCARRGSIGSAGSSQSYGNTNLRNSRNVRDSEVPASMVNFSSNALELMHLSDEPKGMRGIDMVDSRVGVLDNCLSSKGSPHREKVGNKAYITKTLSKDQRESDKSASVATLDSKGIKKESRDGNGVKLSSSSFWECIFCTYHNELIRDVCEICGKSRQPGNEDKPLISGGRECPKCTLVNERGVSSCQACSESLKNSPTYI